MPIYEYACPDCGDEFERLQKMSDPPVTDCPACGAGNVRKLISQTSFVLKGGGWYKDHYGLKGGSGAESKGAESKGGESKGAESKDAESKGAESKGGESKGAESKGAESKGSESKGAQSKGGAAPSAGAGETKAASKPAKTTSSAAGTT